MLSVIITDLVLQYRYMRVPQDSLLSNRGDTLFYVKNCNNSLCYGYLDKSRVSLLHIDSSKMERPLCELLEVSKISIAAIFLSNSIPPILS